MKERKRGPDPFSCLLPIPRPGPEPPPENAGNARLHPLHRLLVHLLLFLRHLLDPLLAILPNLLLHELVLPLAPLPHLVLVRLALLEPGGEARFHAVEPAAWRFGAKNVA